MITSEFKSCLRLGTLALFFGPLLGSLPPASAQGAAKGSQVLYSIDFESAQMGADGVKVGKGKTYVVKREGGGEMPQIVFDPAARSKVLDVVVGPTPKGAPKDRSEMQLYSGVDFGRTWAVQLRVLVPKAKVGEEWQIFAQCPQGEAPHPALSLNLIGPDQIALVSRTDGDDYNALAKSQIPIGRWFVVQIEFKLGPQGSAALWIDGQKAGSATAKIGYAEAGSRCNFKLGTYRGASSSPFEIRFDDLKLADDRAALIR